MLEALSTVVTSAVNVENRNRKKKDGHVLVEQSIPATSVVNVENQNQQKVLFAVMKHVAIPVMRI